MSYEIPVHLCTTSACSSQGIARLPSYKYLDRSMLAFTKSETIVDAITHKILKLSLNHVITVVMCDSILVKFAMSRIICDS